MVHFSSKIQKANNNVLIVDAMNVAFRWKHQGKYVFADEYIATVQSLAKSYDCSNIVMTADKGSSLYRKNIEPEYKANRADKYKDQTEKEKEEMVLFFDEYERALALCAEKLLILRYDRVEADDLAAYIVKHRERLGIEDIWMISSDRDWDLLISENVSRFSTVTRKETTLLNWNEHSEVSVEQYISFKALTGDKGDNIEGIPGIGPKRAADLIKEHGSAFDIYDKLPIASHYKFIQALNASGDLILKNYELMDLLTYCEEAIMFPGHSLSDIDEKLGAYL